MLFIMDIIFTIIAGLITICLICRACYIIGFRKGCLRGIDGCRKITNDIFDAIKKAEASGDDNEKQ